MKLKILLISLGCILSLCCSLLILIGFNNGEEFEFELNNDSYILTKYNEKHSNDIKHIIIPDEYNNLPVTVIGFKAFSSAVMKEITLGANIKEIGLRAFMDCKELERVNFNNQLRKINYSAFKNCESLKEIYLPSSLEELGNSVFDNCYNLESLTLNSDIDRFFDSLSHTNHSLIAIHLNTQRQPKLSTNYLNNINPYLRIYVPEEQLGAYHSNINWKRFINRVYADISQNYYYQDNAGVWYDSESKIILLNAPRSLGEQFYVPDSVKIIANYAFYKSKLISVSMGSDLELIEREAFSKSLLLSTIVFNDKLLRIENKAFYSIWGITKVSFPSSLEYIGDYAFGYCSFLNNINIPSTIKFIEKTAFSSTPWFNSLDDEFVVVGDGILIKYNGSSKSIIVPEEVRVLAWSIDTNFRKSVVYVNLSNIEIIAKETLYFPNLENIVFSANLTDIDYNMLDYQPWVQRTTDDFIIVSDNILIRIKAKGVSIEIPENIRFIMSSNLLSSTRFVVLSDNVEIIGRKAFADSRIEEIIIGSNIQEIREDAFLRCIFLESVSIHSLTPPNIKDNNLKNVDIFVPEESLDLYKELLGIEYNIFSLKDKG